MNAPDAARPAAPDEPALRAADQPAPEVPVPAVTTSRPASPTPFAEEPYEYERCTITLTLQFWPEDGDAQGRRVLIGVRNHQDVPILRLAREQELGELPSPLSELLAQLRAELPERERAREAAEAKRRAEEAAAAERKQAAHKTKKGRAVSRPSIASPETPQSVAPPRPVAPAQAAPTSSTEQLDLFALT